MNEIVKYEDVENKVIIIQNQPVVLDRDVAELYGVETKRINEAVSNNPEKFPEGYIIILNNQDLDFLRSKFSTANISSKTRVPPKAITEKGLYMLATILKSPVATLTTIAIVEAFANLRELNRNIKQIPTVTDESEQKSLANRIGDAIFGLFDDDIMEMTGDMRSAEINLPFIKLSRTVTLEKRKEK